MVGCAVELIAGGLGGICITALAAWYLITKRTRKGEPTEPSTP